MSTLSHNPLVDPEELKALATSPGTVVVDCRYRLTDPEAGLALYRSGHLPGAHYLDLAKDLSAAPGAHGGRHPLPAADAFQAAVRRIGIAPETRVIAYGDQDGSGSARLWWLMRYFGHHSIYVLNGGIEAWIGAGFGLSVEASAPAAQGNFVAHPNHDLTIDRDRLRASLTNVRLIDSRSPERYRGEVEPVDRVAGHIPGAECWDYHGVLSESGRYHDREWLDAYYQPLSKSSKPVVVYCGSGVTACVNLLAMNAVNIDARLYPGSWSDWISYSDAPIALGSESPSAW